MRKTLFLVIVLASTLLNTTAVRGENTDPLSKKIFVLMKTSLGDIYLELYPLVAPKTVQNFIALATGQKSWTDPKTNTQKKTPYYDNLIFHRVIDNFMIQGGCPLGNGRGGPGYTFEDEINAKALGLDKLPVTKFRGLRVRWRQVQAMIFHKLGIRSRQDLEAKINEVKQEMQKIQQFNTQQFLEYLGYQFNDKLPTSLPPRKGCICMANAGPNTNGSQFFINLIDTDWLDGCHTVFGRVVKGFDVVKKIGAVKVDAQKRPITPVRIISIRVVPAEALKGKKEQQAAPQKPVKNAPGKKSDVAPPTGTLKGKRVKRSNKQHPKSL